MSKHTRGPWQVEPPEEWEPPSAHPVIVGGARGTEAVAAILGPLSDEDGPHRGHYDLSLIKAAPDLLAVCECVLEATEGPALALFKLENMRHLLAAAVRKAKGEPR